MRFVLRMLPTVLLAGLSLAAQTGTKVSGVATTSAPCSPSSVAGEFKNEGNCTFIENKYQIVKLTKSVTVSLSKADLDYIAHEVAQLILESLPQRAPDVQVPTLYMANSSIPGWNTLGNASTMLTTSQGNQASAFQMPVSANGSLIPAALSVPTYAVPSDVSGIGIPALNSSLAYTGASALAGIAGAQSVETDQFLKINSLVVASSANSWLSTLPALASTGGIAGYLQVNTDGSVRIAGTSASALGSSIAWAGANSIVSDLSATMTGGIFAGPSATDKSLQGANLLIGSDGQIQLDGVALKAEPEALIGPGTVAAPWPGVGTATALGTSNTGQFQWPPCGPGVVITISANGIVTPCNQGGDSASTQ